MIKEAVVTTHAHHDHAACFHFKRISWSAIFVGALIAIGLGFLLNLFGMAIGITALNMDDNGAFMVSVGGLIAILIGVIVSMLVAGYAAGYLGRLYCPQRNLGILYGFATWSLALLLSAILAAYAADYVANYTSNLTNTSVVGSNSDNTASLQTTNTDQNQKPAANVKASPGTLAWGAFIVFALFFIGAFSCCVGALWGMSCRRDD
ncbi:Uncharacterised protein (plasmid) [Legionella adelaidensis]|uniref:Transmembrane protein n=1 Tax=Legionella adelaidensis TaxID=45056 RepID=A0A0W0R1V4_9GAMM|nr:hypothetical protein [Legionella adelaidensis]KTC65073.1 hypothetical protein Lade_1596 [Legionella adelaidensis]VEH85407.1 Uncharacterised protein [Legionella adelaidensis]